MLEDKVPKAPGLFVCTDANSIFHLDLHHTSISQSSIMSIMKYETIEQYVYPLEVQIAIFHLELQHTNISKQYREV